MTDIKKIMVDYVVSQKQASPCYGKTFDECFTEERGFLWLWYNAPNHSTKIFKVKLP